MLSSDGSSITLAWKSPKHCGGSKVNAYYIDKRNADTLVWAEVNLAGITEKVCTVSGLDYTRDRTIRSNTRLFPRLMYKLMMTFSVCSGQRADSRNLLRVQGPGR